MKWGGWEVERSPKPWPACMYGCGMIMPRLGSKLGLSCSDDQVFVGVLDLLFFALVVSDVVLRNL